MDSKLKRISLTIYLTVASALYILFIFFKNDVPVIPLEYAGILLNLLYSFILFGNKIDTYLVRLALLFTAISDLFLLVLSAHELVGVLVFSVVQLLYAYRLILNNQRKTSLEILFRLASIFIFQIVLILINEEDLLTIITFFYFANLFSNVVISLYRFNTNRMFALGLFLFMLCDIFVGLNNSAGYLAISETSVFYQLIHLPIDLMWFFYYPAQVFLTLSILTGRESGDILLQK